MKLGSASDVNVYGMRSVSLPAFKGGGRGLTDVYSEVIPQIVA
jgi:hypothetical protein